MIEVLVPSPHKRLTCLERVEMASGVQLGSYWPIEYASAAVENFIGRVLRLEMVKETFLPTTPSWKLMLSRWPVVSIISVTEDGRAVDPAAYELCADSGILLRRVGNRSASWLQGVRTVVEYMGGYRCGELQPLSSAEILAGVRPLPGDIELATIQLIVAQRYATGSSEPQQVRRVQAGGGGIEVDFGGAMAGTLDLFPANVKAMLKPYRVPRI